MQQAGAGVAAIETGEAVQTSPTINRLTETISPAVADKIKQAAN